MILSGFVDLLILFYFAASPGGVWKKEVFEYQRDKKNVSKPEFVVFLQKKIEKPKESQHQEKNKC